MLRPDFNFGCSSPVATLSGAEALEFTGIIVATRLSLKILSRAILSVMGTYHHLLAESRRTKARRNRKAASEARLGQVLFPVVRDYGVTVNVSALQTLPPAVVTAISSTLPCAPAGTVKLS